jgi:ABC-type phosphate transport system substrate-binding protein
VFGSATPSQLGALTHTALFQEVYGLFINTSGINGGATGQILNLDKNTVGAILAGSITDWSQVPSGTGVVSSTPKTITVVNREAGSGTRTGAGIYFLNIGCSGSAAINDPTPGNDSYATSDALAAAAGIAGSITYASIDNAGKQAALSIANLNGVVPSNFNATNGSYDWWTEAQLVKGTITSTGGSTIYTWLVTELAKVSTAPHTLDINAIPGVAGNTPTSPPALANTLGGVSIYVNPFTKGGNKTNSCAAPSYL